MLDGSLINGGFALLLLWMTNRYRDELIWLDLVGVLAGSQLLTFITVILLKAFLQ